MCPGTDFMNSCIQNMPKYFPTAVCSTYWSKQRVWVWSGNNTFLHNNVAPSPLISTSTALPSHRNRQHSAHQQCYFLSAPIIPSTAGTAVLLVKQGSDEKLNLARGDSKIWRKDSKMLPARFFSVAINLPSIHFNNPTYRNCNASFQYTHSSL